MFGSRSVFGALSICLALTCTTVMAAEWGLKKGEVELQSARSLAFGPDGILFVGDAQAATVYAIDTGGRRGFHRAAAGVMALSHRQDQPMCLALVDVDNFKTINDTMGHYVGDRALAGITGILTAGVREGDIIGRLGGDEFALILPFTDAPTSRDVVERLRRSIESTPIRAGSRSVSLTASIGVALVDPAHASLSETMKQADEALYAAKAHGPNRVTVFGDDR